MRTEPSVEAYAAGVRAGDRTSLGRALTLVESNRADHRAQAQELLKRLQNQHADTIRVGISGVPGAGKSTFISALGLYLIEHGHRVAVLAVDPSSSVSGGSILGDKTRMGELAVRDEAFIRPSPTGGSLGGVARKTRESIVVCEAAGFDVVLVETVGVGQSETVVADMVDFFLVLMLAGAGDELQGIKRGILELADLVVVNKADGDNRVVAERARSELERAMAILRPRGRQPWTPPVLTCSARYATGLEPIWQAVEEHRQQMSAAGVLAERRRRQLVRWMWAMVDDALTAAVREDPAVCELAVALEHEVRDGRSTPTLAAAAILAAFGHSED